MMHRAMVTIGVLLLILVGSQAWAFYNQPVVDIGNFVFIDNPQVGEMRDPFENPGPDEDTGLDGVLMGLQERDSQGNWVDVQRGGQAYTAVTCGGGYYYFESLPANQRYRVVVLSLPDAPDGKIWVQTYERSDDEDGNHLDRAAVKYVAQAPGYDWDFDFGFMLREPTPSMSMVKTADTDEIDSGQSVTYTYIITNTGGQPIYGLIARDDNGTPGYAFDDFTVGQAAVLPVGGSVTFTATKSLAVQTNVVVNNSTYPSGFQTAEVLPNGDVKFTFVQSRNITDNTYGTTAAPDWPNGHKFGDLTGSDKSGFRFTDATGKVVMDFYLDYISASSAYPSGYGSLGCTGGDGKLVVGSAAYLKSYTTSLTQNLNQSPAYYGYTVNSPAEPNANWNYNSMYQMVVAAAAFGTAGFGSAVAYEQHNSPSKLGTNALYPVPEDTEVTNTVSATGTAEDGTVLSAQATATVWVYASSGTTSSAAYTTYKQDQWGGVSSPGTAGELLDKRFATVYPAGLTVGGSQVIVLTSADAVDAFLPQGGGPNVLPSTYTNPTKTGAGELAGQVVALKLNVDFSAAGLTKSGLASLKLTKDLAGWTVAQVLAMAQVVLGGDKTALPKGVDLKKLKDICKRINENYEQGTHDRGYLKP